MSSFDACLPFARAHLATESWTLAPGRAIALRAAQPGVLFVRAGALWATCDGPHTGHAGGPAGDEHLRPGSRLRVQAGQRWVLEPIHAHPGTAARAEPVTLIWQPLTRAVAWRASVAGPAAELRAALGHAGGALARLLRGLWGWRRAGRGLSA